MGVCRPEDGGRRALPDAETGQRVWHLFGMGMEGTLGSCEGACMLLVSVLVIALTVGLIRGGDLGAFSQHRWRWPILPAGAIILQVIAFLPDVSHPGATRLVAGSLHLASYLLTIAFVWVNHKTPWVWLIGIGLATNFLVIAANGGFMPVSAQVLPGTSSAPVGQTDVYHNSRLMGEATRLRFLGDIYRTPDWFRLKRAFSLGDVLIGLGAFALVQRLMGITRLHASREVG